MKNQLKASIRKAIITHRNEGMSYNGIIYQLRAFNVTLKQVRCTLKKCQESNSIEDTILDKRVNNGRQRSKRTPEVVCVRGEQGWVQKTQLN